MMGMLVERIKQGCGIARQLKSGDLWRWVQEVGSIRNAAKAFGQREVAYG